MRNRKSFTPLEIPTINRRNERFLTGFTLIELIILVIILGIIATVIIVSVSNTVSATRGDAARLKLRGDIIYAQNLAVTQQINHGVIFNTAAETYSVYRQNTATVVNNPLTTAPFTVNYTSDTNFIGVDLASASFGSPTTNKVEFDSFGVPSDGTANLTADGSVTLSAGGNTYTVTVTKNTGKVN